jgi:hypothetical protein
MIAYIDEPISEVDARAISLDGSTVALADGGNFNNFRVSFAGVAEFLIDFGRKDLRIFRLPGCSEPSIRHLLGDQILPRILAHQGALVLHAAAAENDRGMVLFVGLSGSGKSTLAASLHNNGYRLVGDDAILVSAGGERALGRAVYRSLRLFPDSVEALVAGDAHVTGVATYTAKRNVIFPDDDRSNQPVPIRAAFLLDPTPRDHILVEAINASEACIAFIEHSFWMDPSDLGRTKRRITQASTVAETVPTFRFAYPRDYAALSAVHEAIAGILY